VNRRACELHGFDRTSLIGVNIQLLAARDERDRYGERIERILAGETLSFETEHYKKDGSSVILEISAKALDIGGEPSITSFHQGHHGKEEDPGTVDAFTEDGICRIPCGRNSP
jgi:PAS domain S-box-containing protein